MAFGSSDAIGAGPAFMFLEISALVLAVGSVVWYLTDPKAAPLIAFFVFVGVLSLPGVSMLYAAVAGV